MIGALLNYVQRGYKASLNIGTGNQFTGNIFGYGTRNFTITPNTFMTNETLAFKNGNSLEFHDLTVENNAVLSPITNTDDIGNATKSNWNTLFLKCSGTLTVNGLITSAHTGSRSSYWDNRQIHSTNISPIPITIPTTNPWGDYGFSTPATTFFRLHGFGLNNSFFTHKLFLLGGSACGCHSWRKGRHHNRHYDHSRNYGISYGGGGAYDHNNWGGNGGGFVALYYEHLIIDGKEYGVDAGCDISRISANGTNSADMDGQSGRSSSGGCIVIAAKTIIINGGSINSDGGFFETELNNANVLCENYAKRKGTAVYKYALLNNLAQLNTSAAGGAAQTGMYWDSINNTFAIGTNGNPTYYYDDGTGNGVCNQALPGSPNSFSVGAGVALGFKVR